MADCNGNAFDAWPRYLTSTERLATLAISYGTTALICPELTKINGAVYPIGRKTTCTWPIVIGTCVQVPGQVVESSFTGMAGPMGLAPEVGA